MDTFGAVEQSALALSSAPTAAEVALSTNTLGVGFSGSGFLVMYFVGVTAILKSLGILSTTTKYAGASGGSVAGAMSCGDASTASFFTAAATLASTCRSPLANNCQGTLNTAVRTGLLVALPLDAHTKCRGRLFAAVTKANTNPAADVGSFLTTFANRNQLISSLATSSYIPRFSGLSAVTQFNTSLVAYDGVCSNPLPVPPASSGVTYTIKVSALANGTSPPNFSSLVTFANANPSSLDTLGAAYRPLNPTIQPQPPSVDIYPGLSGTLKITNAAWNNFVLVAPNNTSLQYIYNMGRADAAAWVAANMPSIPAARISQAMATTNFTLVGA